MLVLSRRVGERLVIGDVEVAVVGIHAWKGVFLVIEGTERTVRVNKGSRVELTPGVFVGLADVKFSRARLTFDAPPSVRIMRKEIIDGDAAT